MNINAYDATDIWHYVNVLSVMNVPRRLNLITMEFIITSKSRCALRVSERRLSLHRKEKIRVSSAGPCPFCYKTESLYMIEDDPRCPPIFWQVVCISCQASGPLGIDRKNAIDLWNRRVPRDD